MEVKKISDLRAPDGRSIPAIVSLPEPVRSGVVLLHPYGGGKEQMLGLAFALGQMDVAALAVDLPSHGGNHEHLTLGALKTTVEAALVHMRHRFGRAGCAGVGLGATLALLSSAEYVAAIAPALPEKSQEHISILQYLPQPGVHDAHTTEAELLEHLGTVPTNERHCLIVSPEREVPEIAEAVKALQSRLPHARIHQVITDLRPDLDHESAVIRYLQRSWNHQEMAFNAEAIEIAARWLAQMPGFLEQEQMLKEAEGSALSVAAKAGN